ncbi:ABC transporter permease [Alicyclobacillus herbarius]|uniref:ABC transporter permease n=1 Tax=Alicyclobacillus herbarius TaxID=122960 RepID=UPI000427EB65|nr:ABC transporter permease [Alicyclobacillus herbarius]
MKMRASSRFLPSLLVAAALLPFVYIAAPLLHMFTTLSPAEIEAELTNLEFIRSAAASVLAALLTTAVASVFGLPSAFLLSLRPFFGRRLLEALLLLPLLLPPVVGGIGQLFLYGPMTPVGAWFGAHGVPLTNSVLGVFLAQSYITSPYLILTAKAGFEDVPPELAEVTRTLGGGLWDVFWHISLPLARPAIFSGMLLTFARAIGEFGATMIIAYHPYTLPVEVWVQFTSGGLAAVVPIAALVTAFALVVGLVATSWQTRRR